jgi:hypothetical protein
MSHPDDRSVHPVFGPDGETDHVTDGSPCWCEPRMMVPCSQCDDDDPDAHCWKCGGEGLVEIDRRIGPAVPVIFIHNEA